MSPKPQEKTLRGKIGKIDKHGKGLGENREKIMSKQANNRKNLKKKMEENC